VIHVAIHPSQYPERVQADLLTSLRKQQIQHKFHYDSHKQAQKWLAVHEAHSPARKDPDCLAVYEKAFNSIAQQFPCTKLHVIGLGCGGGQKDAALLERFTAAGSPPLYSAVDVSLPLVITARLRAANIAESTTGLVCDLETADDVRDELCDCSATQRVLTFFGMMPNSEPQVILPRLKKLLGDGDVLLVSANLAPGTDYRAGVERVLPQYDNPETAEWLLTFLYDIGVDRGDGALQFGIEESASGLLRIRADYHFARNRSIRVSGENFEFAPGERIRLFYSYRYTPALLKRVLSENDLAVTKEWVGEQEGVFAVTK
jgi:uncharacterized SAM-dependent methyltransferase